MKLHIGGKQKKEGWKILNIQKSDNVDFVGDITNLDQFKENSIDEIYASHVLEHVNQNDIENTLIGIYRILSNKGKFYVSVPDLDILCKMFLDPSSSLDIKWHTMRMMFGGQTDKYDFHYFGWNFLFLNGYLNKIGFKNIERVKTFSLFEDGSNFEPYGKPISLNVIAHKIEN
tara:strand:+ start:21 stop:539 length:519 start_codon:yes stop_codon:yes gene_type:complete